VIFYCVVTEAKTSALFMSFNRELIERIQRYSLSHCDQEISEETATEYLDALASLYESFIELATNKE
jgi:hypothetical protein